MLGCCVLSYHFLWAIHPIRPVLKVFQTQPLVINHLESVCQVYRTGTIGHISGGHHYYHNHFYRNPEQSKRDFRLVTLAPPSRLLIDHAVIGEENLVGSAVIQRFV